MGAADPQQAVWDELSGPQGVWEPGGRDAGGVQGGVVHGGRLEQADLTTVRFVKHRRSATRHVYFVAFEGTIPHLGPGVLSFHYVYPVESDPAGGWRVFGGAGGAGDAPRRSRPWVNLGGGGWPDCFYAGGLIEHAGARIHTVELRFANGLVLRDDTTDAVALFITDETAAVPANLVLLDETDAEVASQQPFPEL